MLKKIFKNGALLLTTSTILCCSLAGCFKELTPSNPHDAVSLALSNSLKGVSGYDELKEKYDYSSFFSNLSTHAVNVNTNLQLTNFSPAEVGSPELSLNYSADPNKPAAALNLGLVSDILSQNLEANIYLDSGKIIFGLPDITKTYSVDLSLFDEASSSNLKELITSYQQEAPSIFNLPSLLSEHIFNDYEEAWNLCNITKTDNLVTYVLSNSENIDCTEYTIEVNAESAKKFVETFCNWLRVNSDVQTIIEDNNLLSAYAQDIQDAAEGTEYLASVNALQDDLNSLINPDEVIIFKAYVADNKLRALIMRTSSTTNEIEDASDRFELHLLGDEHPLDEIEFGYTTEDNEYYVLNFTANKSDTTEYKFSISSSEASDKLIDATFTYNESTDDINFILTANSLTGDTVNLTADLNSTVNVPGESYSTLIKDFNLSTTGSDNDDFSLGLMGEVNVSLTDSIEEPTVDVLVTNEEELTAAQTEIYTDFMNNFDMSGLVSLFS